MAYSFVFFRDRIVLNNDLKQRMELDSTPLGSTILLAAREFVVNGPFTLDGRDAGYIQWWRPDGAWEIPMPERKPTPRGGTFLLG